MRDAAGNVRGAVNSAIDRVSSRDEKAALDAAYDRWQRAQGTDDELQAWAEYDVAKAKYDNTLGAKARNAAGQVGEAVTGAPDKIRDAIERATTTAKLSNDLHKALKEYDKAKGTKDEKAAFWAVMDAQSALESYTGKESTYGFHFKK